MLNKVLETYRCLLSCRKNMPGMSLEDAFYPEAVKELEAEQKWLLSQASINEEALKWLDKLFMYAPDCTWRDDLRKFMETAKNRGTQPVA